VKDDKQKAPEQRYIIQDLEKIKNLVNQGQLKEALLIVSELEKSAKYSHRAALLIRLLKADIFSKLGEYLKAIDCADGLFQQFKKEEDLISSYDILLIQASSLAMLGKINESEALIEQAEILLSKIKKDCSLDLRERESFLARIKANLNIFNGDVQGSLKFNKKAYELVKDTHNIILISASLNNLGFNYFSLKEYDNAIKYLKEAVRVGYEPLLAFPLGNLIEIYIRKGNYKEAQVYFENLGELKEKYNNKIYNEIYDMYKALLLKSSLRARKRIESEDIFKRVAFDDSATFEGRIAALIQLCDLLLIELHLTDDPEILNEIQPYIQKLLELAEHQQSSVIIPEVYLLQAKISLLTFDNLKAKRFLTQAKQIAERFGNKEMVERIMIEQSTLHKKSSTWEQLKDTGASMAERIKLARLHEQIEELDEKRVILPAFITEEKVAIHKELKICVVCRGEALKFTYICDCGAIYCDNCARALTGLENVCWICESPIDYTKPVKFYEQEFDDIKIAAKDKKQQK